MSSSEYYLYIDTLFNPESADIKYKLAKGRVMTMLYILTMQY